MKPVAVIDGSNVAVQERSNDGRAKMETLMKMRRLLETRGYRPILIVDAKLRYDVDDRKQFDHLEEEGIILQAPAGTDADYFVLRTAEEANAVLISNDRYRDHQQQFPWVDERRIPFMVVDGNIILYCPSNSTRCLVPNE